MTNVRVAFDVWLEQKRAEHRAKTGVAALIDDARRDLEVRRLREQQPPERDRLN